MAVKKTISEPVEPIKPVKVPPVNVLAPAASPSMPAPSIQPQTKMDFLQKIQALLFHPFRFTEYVQQEQGFLHTLLFSAEISAIYLTIIAVVLGLSTNSIIGFIVTPAYLIGAIFGYFLVGLPVAFVVGLVLHGGLKLFRGQGTFSDTMRAQIYSGIPSLFLLLPMVLILNIFLRHNFVASIVSIIFSLLISLYTIVIDAWYLAAVHKISKLAAGGVLVAMNVFWSIVAFVIAFIFFFVLGIGIGALKSATSPLTLLTNYSDSVTTITSNHRGDAIDKINPIIVKPIAEWTAVDKRFFDDALTTIDGLSRELELIKDVPSDFTDINHQLLVALQGYHDPIVEYRAAVTANDEKAISVSLEKFIVADEAYMQVLRSFELQLDQKKKELKTVPDQQSLLQGLKTHSI